MKKSGQIEIWFFIGSLVLVYGILITGAGIYYLIKPPEHLVVLGELHSDIWWGALLICIGSFYVFRYWPFGKGKSS
ncbi:MAG TPA: hypothetical protein VIS48_09495 [Candidatus Kryptonia bacterium]